MKIKTILVLLIFFSGNSIKSQITIQFNSLNEYMFSTKEALNLNVINSGTKSVEVNFYGRISRPDEGTVVEFKSESYVLNIGSNFITPMTVSIRDINYYNKDIAEIEQKTGTYPSGNYSVCIWTACTSPDCNGSGSGAGNTEQPICTQIHIENPTPLILSYPDYDSEIEETRPIYTWIPPAPVAGSSGLNYMLTLVEIMDGQSKSEALSINRPLIEIEGLSNPMLMHPSDLPELEEGKSYAWQVQAFVGKTYFARSEQWKFKVIKDTIDLKKIPRELSYIDISGQTGTSMFYAVGQIKLKYTVRLKSGIVTMEIKDKSGEKIDIAQNLFHISPGDNRMSLDLEAELRFKHGEIYTLSGRILTGEIFTIKFTYINPKLLSND